MRNGFLFENRRIAFAVVEPNGGVRIFGVVAFCFAVVRLVFDTEVRAAAFASVESVANHNFGEVEEVRHAAGSFEFGVERIFFAHDFKVFPEFRAQLRDKFESLFQAFFPNVPCRSIPTLSCPISYGIGGGFAYP